MDNKFKFLIMLFVFIIFISSGFLIKSIVKDMKKFKHHETYIPFSQLPELSRTIHCCNNIININYNIGDILEVCDGNGKSYHIVCKDGVYKLTMNQVRYLEKIYSIKIF